MQVIKVGGSVLNSVTGFSRLAGIISNASTGKLLIVISAFSKTTRNLSDMAHAASKGHLNKSIRMLASIIRFHKNFAAELINDKTLLREINADLESTRKSIGSLLSSMSLTKELPLRIMDQILSYGEELALMITDRFLSFNLIKHQTVSSVDIIVTDELFGRANPLEKETSSRINRKLLPAISDCNVVLTQGFVACSKKGNITTMGVESSNLTAALYAKLLNVSELIIWSDVSGIRSADPLIAADTKQIADISYDKAYEYGLSGLKLIYPGMIAYARANNIRLIFKSAFKPESGSTIVKLKSKSNLPLIVSKGNQYFYRLQNVSENYKMLNPSDTKFIDGIEMVVISEREINFKSGNNNSESEYYSNICMITIFNVAMNKFIAALNGYYTRRNNNIIFSTAVNGKIVIAVKSAFANPLIKYLHESIVVN